MASVDLTGAEDAGAPPKSPSSGGSDEDPPPGAVEMGVVDELMHALSASKVALAVEREATTPLKQKLRRAQSEAEQLQERLDTLQESADAQRFEVCETHGASRAHAAENTHTDAFVLCITHAPSGLAFRNERSNSVFCAALFYKYPRARSLALTCFFVRSARLLVAACFALGLAPQELQREVADLRVRSDSLQRANAHFRASGAAGALSEELADAVAELAALRDEMAER